MVKIIGICGSPRKDGNCETMLKIALKKVKSLGAETEIILLSEKNIKPCKGCTPKCTEPCLIKDDMHEIYKKMQEADGIILATPCYYGGPSALTRILIERSVYLDRKGALLKGKIGGIISVGGMRHGGQELTANSIKNWMLIHAMKLLDDNNWPTSNFGAAGFAYNVGDIQNDKEGLKSAELLGEKIVNVCKMEAK